MNRTCVPSNQEAADSRLRLHSGRELHNRPTDQHRVHNRSQLQPLRWQQPTNQTYVHEGMYFFQNRQQLTHLHAHLI